MSKKTAAQASNLDNLTIAPACKVCTTEYDREQDKMLLVSLEQTFYTPRHINEAMKKHNLTTAWVRWSCGKELWLVGEQIAKKSARVNRRASQ